jgi:hypothetical protein
MDHLLSVDPEVSKFIQKEQNRQQQELFMLLTIKDENKIYFDIF